MWPHPSALRPGTQPGKHSGKSAAAGKSLTHRTGTPVADASHRQRWIRGRAAPWQHEGNLHGAYEDTEEITIREVSYDVNQTCQAIIDAGLPEAFAWRLSHGFEYAERAEDASHVCER